MNTKSAVAHDVSAGHSFAGMSGDRRTSPDLTRSQHSMVTRKNRKNTGYSLPNGSKSCR